MSSNQTNNLDWKSPMSRPLLIARHKVLVAIRKFFDERGVLEVETPILSEARVSDVHLECFKTQYLNKEFFLNTSPEYHMKRLLASGSGPIYQICKCFRLEESSKKHNPEFTMLEWYRTGYTLQRLLDEVEDLFKVFFEFDHMDRLTYDYVFRKYLGFSALDASHSLLVEQANNFGLHNAEAMSSDDILEFLFSTRIEPNLGLIKPVAIYNYPASQCALAQITPEDPRTSQRAEVFYKGIELANGFYELTDAQQQRRRFEADIIERKKNNMEVFPLDERFLAALESGLPNSSGIALGLDRFVMLVMNKDSIQDVMSFNIENS